MTVRMWVFGHRSSLSGGLTFRPLRVIVVFTSVWWLLVGLADVTVVGVMLLGIVQ